jgi:hypothetical protein
MSICESCKNFYTDGWDVYCKDKEAYNQLIKRAIFHEERTKNYKLEFKRLDAFFALRCAISELKKCVYYKKKIFKKITGSNNFTHSDIKDIFEIN